MARRHTTPERLLKRMAKKAPHVMAGIRHFRNKSLRYIEEWVQQYRAPDADRDDIREQIATQVESMFGIRTKVAAAKNADEEAKEALWNMDVWREIFRQSDEGTIAEYVECYQELATYPEKTVAAAFEALRRQWADGCTAEDQLTMQEGALRAWFGSLDDRTRYIATTLQYMMSRERLLEYLDEISREVTEDFGFLDEKEDEYRDDPQLAILVRLNDLLAQVDAGEHCAV